jgi:hypothetical protein
MSPCTRYGNADVSPASRSRVEDVRRAAGPLAGFLGEDVERAIVGRLLFLDEYERFLSSFAGCARGTSTSVAWHGGKATLGASREDGTLFAWVQRAGCTGRVNRFPRERAAVLAECLVRFAHEGEPLGDDASPVALTCVGVVPTWMRGGYGRCVSLGDGSVFVGGGDFLAAMAPAFSLPAVAPGLGIAGPGFAKP